MLPRGEYLATLETVRPRLVTPGGADDYFSGEQVALWGVNAFWGLPHDPRTEYYRSRSASLGGGAALFEFIVPMFPHGWLDDAQVASYEARPPADPPPTALAISVLDVKQPAVLAADPEIDAHWCLAHYLLDGHHKVCAAARTGRPVGLLWFLALERGVSTDEEVGRLLAWLHPSRDGELR